MRLAMSGLRMLQRCYGCSGDNAVYEIVGKYLGHEIDLPACEDCCMAFIHQIKEAGGTVDIMDKETNQTTRLFLNQDYSERN